VFAACGKIHHNAVHEEHLRKVPCRFKNGEGREDYEMTLRDKTLKEGWIGSAKWGSVNKWEEETH
jgi:hypothetical protein